MDKNNNSGLTPEQYQWLKVRMGADSDTDALRITGITRNQLRHWMRNTHFVSTLDVVREDKIAAFKLLSFSLSESALSALEYLLESQKGSDKRAGLEIWMKINHVGQEVEEKNIDIPQQVFNILNMRGDVPTTVLDIVQPSKRLKAKTIALDTINVINEEGDSNG